MEECKMTELEKLKAAKEVIDRLYDSGNMEETSYEWIVKEIARLEDPFAQAKHKLHGWSKSETTTAGTWNLIQYVEHLKNERDHYKIQYEHAKEAAAEPLDPKRVLATAAKVCDGSVQFHNGTDQRVIADTAERLIWLCGINAKPYEVQE
jgi:hypothetical protein